MCVCVCVVEKSFAASLVSDAAFSASGAEQSHRRTSTELILINIQRKPWEDCQVDYSSVPESLYHTLSAETSTSQS